ncbi:hypothetical protein TNCT_216881 [Trichonephila clavata]|uniref:Uncharacterized protein n=1 Tax=Trichonephila clavata TaxID=2740835 RepID=A0A8X6KDT4_TRICU|nr:hypothetical protein TNCT_216881 [Trichonephila clavata]
MSKNIMRIFDKRFYHSQIQKPIEKALPRNTPGSVSSPSDDSIFDDSLPLFPAMSGFPVYCRRPSQKRFRFAVCMHMTVLLEMRNED